MVDMVADSADEVTPRYGRLPGLQLAATPGDVFLSPEIGPVSLFSPASEASTHFSPAPAGHGLQTATGAVLSQSLFSPEDAAAQRCQTRNTPGDNLLAIERCISLVNQSPAAGPGPGPALSALPVGPGPALSAAAARTGPGHALPALTGGPGPGPALPALPGGPGPGPALSALTGGPGPALSALPVGPRPALLAAAAGLGPGPAASAVAGSSVATPVCTLRWPAGSYGLDSDEGDSDGRELTVPEGCSQNHPELDALPPEGQSSGQSRPDRTQSSDERWPDRGLHTESVRPRRAAAGDCRRRREQWSRQTRSQQGADGTRSQQGADGKRRLRERERHRVCFTSPKEDGGNSETRRQLSLLSRLRPLLGRLKTQLDDDGESITTARLRELKNRLRPCSAALASLMSGHMSKDVSRRLAKVQEVSNTLLLRMKMLETRCRSAREDSSQTHVRLTAGGGAIRKRGEDRPRQTKPFARDRRKKVPSPILPSLDPPTPESSSPDPPSPGAPFAPSDDEQNTPKENCVHAASPIMTRPTTTTAVPAAAATATAAAAVTSTAAAPMGGALPAPPAGSGPWFWQWPMGLPAGYPAWPPPPPWFGAMPWDRQPPLAAVPTTAPPPSAAPVPLVGSQPPVEPSDGGTQKLAPPPVPHHSVEQVDPQTVAASDCGRSPRPACGKEVAKAPGCRSLLLRLQTVRLVDDCELLPLSGDCWDRPETLLEWGDGWWD